MRVVFMGTPEFAVPSLRALVQAGHEVAAVVTQPDRPAGRSGRPQPPPAKRAALDLGIPVLQPARLREPGVAAELRRLAPEVIVVVAFGLILPRDVLAIPSHGCINVHASLLPKYRGAAPINAAILAGEPETGVTIMLIVPALDAGPTLAQRREPIRPDDTTESLSGRLAELGAALLVATLPRWVSRQIRPQAQDESQASYVPMLRREQGRIDWTQPAEYIERQCRAYYPWPGCFSQWDGRLLKLLQVRAIPGWAGTAEPGQVLVGPGAGDLLVAAGEGAVAILRLQPEGKRPMPVAEFLRGHREIAGAALK